MRGADVSDPVEARAIARVRRRLIPFLALLYLVAYLDRFNVGFAALQMNDALGLLGQRLRVWRRHLLHRLLSVRDSQQHDPRARRGADLDRAHRHSLGTGVDGDDVRLRRGAASTRCGSCSARPKPASFPASSTTSPPGSRRTSARGRWRSSRWPAWSPASSAGRSRACCSRFAALGGLDGWQWLFLVEGMPAVVLGLVALWYLDRSTGRRELAAGRREGVADRDASARAGRLAACPGRRAQDRSARPRGLEVCRRLVLHHHQRVRLQLLPAADRSATVGRIGSRRRSADGDPVFRRRRRDGRGGGAFGSDGRAAASRRGERRRSPPSVFLCKHVR